VESIVIWYGWKEKDGAVVLDLLFIFEMSFIMRALNLDPTPISLRRNQEHEFDHSHCFFSYWRYK